MIGTNPRVKNALMYTADSDWLALVRMPPRVSAYRPKPCGGNNVSRHSVINGGGIYKFHLVV